MIWAELKKFFYTRLFWALNAVGLGALLIESLLVAGLDRVGLMPVTAYDYLISSGNLYMTYLLPLLICLFSAYSLASEYQWRTMMIPVFEGKSRLAILGGKVALCGLTTLTFTFIYMAGATGIAFGLFSFNDTLLESRAISPLEAVGRAALSSIWTSGVIFIFGLLALLLVVRFRNPVLATIGSYLAFFVFCLTANVNHNPFAPLLQVPHLLVQAAELGTSNFLVPLLQGVGVWFLTVGGILALLIVVFHRLDIVFE